MKLGLLKNKLPVPSWLTHK